LDDRIGFGLTRYWTGFSVHDNGLDWMHASLVGFLLGWLDADANPLPGLISILVTVILNYG
jgi:hypothetical protein